MRSLLFFNFSIIICIVEISKMTDENWKQYYLPLELVFVHLPCLYQQQQYQNFHCLETCNIHRNAKNTALSHLLFRVLILEFLKYWIIILLSFCASIHLRFWHLSSSSRALIHFFEIILDHLQLIFSIPSWEIRLA